MSSVDLYGDSCNEYVVNSQWCGLYDSPDFNSGLQCCACNNGTVIPVDPIPPADVPVDATVDVPVDEPSDVPADDPDDIPADDPDDQKNPPDDGAGCSNDLSTSD